jgi:hypothetical protein
VRARNPTAPPVATSALALLLGARIAAAEASALQLTWRAPAGCPSAAEVQAQVVELLAGRDVPASRRLLAVTSVERTDRGAFTVHLETNLDGASGERTFEGDSCKTVARTTALILAFALDPGAAERTAPSPPPPAEAKPPPPAEVAPPPSPKPTEPVSFRALASLEAAVVSGVLPKPALAARAAIGVRHGPVGAEIAGLVSDARETMIDRTTEGGTFRFFSLGARFSWEPFRGPWSARVALGGEIERITARGFGVTQPMNGSATVPAALVAAELAWPLTNQLAFRIQGIGTARVDRPRFVLSPTGSVFEVAWANVSGAAGIELTF